MITAQSLREDLANKIGNSFKGVSDKVWDELINGVRRFIPDIFPLNYLENGLVSLFGWMKGFAGDLAYNVGRQIGFFVFDRIDMEVGKAIAHFNYYLDKAEADLKEKIGEVESLLNKAKTELNRRVWNVEVDVGDLKKRVSELEAKIGVSENYQDLIKLLERIKARLGL